MNGLVFILKSLRYYWRTHAGVLLGAALAAAVLTGALMARDDVRYSLERLAFRRIGSSEFAMETGDRYFRVSLASELALRTGRGAAAGLSLDGYAVAGGGEARSNNVNVLGVTDDFWRLSPVETEIVRIEKGETAINERLAAELGVEPQDRILLRVRKAQLMPGEAPFAVGADETHSFTLTVKTVLGDDAFGGFSLRINQIAPKNAFVSLPELAGKMGIEGKANFVLVAGSVKPDTAEEQLDTVDLGAEVGSIWMLEDAGLKLDIENTGDRIDLISDRVFVERAVEEAASDLEGSGILTYFVDGIFLAGAVDAQSIIPYSFVSGVDPRVIGQSIASDEIVLNDWAARDLKAVSGDLIELKYRTPGADGRLEKHSAAFRVHSIVPIDSGDRDLMPQFPGLAEVEETRDWDPGFPLDLSLIRDVDEQYWDLYRGSPKAFIALETAQELWENRYGRLTAIRFNGLDSADGGQSSAATRISQHILRNLDPVTIGLSFLPVREAGQNASRQGTDFGQLFLGLSMFLLASALMLTGMLFMFSIRQRFSEIGILSATGFPPAYIRRMAIIEGAFIAIAGAVLGGFLGILYNKLIVAGLSSLWRDAVRTSAIREYIRLSTVALGAGLGAAAALATMYFVLIRSRRMSTSQLLRGRDTQFEHGKKGSLMAKISLPVSAIALVLGSGLFLYFLLGDKSRQIGGAAGLFFATGTMLLISGLFFFYYLLVRLRSSAGTRVSTWIVGIKGSARRRARSVAVAALLASGIFVVTAVGSNRWSTPQSADDKLSGTGGFELFAETTIPVLDRSEINEAQFSDVEILALRVLEGDDASCLNLNRVEIPKVLGVVPAELAGRFRFSKVLDESLVYTPWEVLLEEGGIDANGEYVIPAVADQTVITWSLGKSVGDELIYLDEKGNRLRLKLVGSLENSIFQGNILISEKAFLKHFPSIAGSKVFLLDSPADRVEEIRNTLSRTMGGFGMDLSTTADRLDEFNSVTNTYLDIFLVLGGLGILVGSIGLGFVVFRNCAESRGEYALLQALGFSRKHVLGVVLVEQFLPLLFGVAVGAIAAIIAVVPAVRSTAVSVIPVLLLSLGICVSGAVWTVIAARAAMPKNLPAALGVAE